MNGLKDYIRASFYTLFHPVAGINDFVEKQAFSFRFSLVPVFLFYLARLLSELCTGTIFSASSEKDTDPGLILIEIFGMLLLWSAATWALSTLFEGKGKLKQIWFVTALATIPYSFFLLINTLLSNVLISNEKIFLTVLLWLGILWSVMLIIVGLMIIQDYSLFGVILNSICTIAAIFVIIFLGVLFFSLVRQLYSFLSDVFRELSYRKF